MFYSDYMVAEYDSRLAISCFYVQSNFDYCPLLWYFCGAVNSRKIKGIQEKAFRFVDLDFESSYEVSANVWGLLSWTGESHLLLLTDMWYTSWKPRNWWL